MKNIINDLKTNDNIPSYDKQKYLTMLESQDQLLNHIIDKIENKTITCEDFNYLISETTPEAIRDRVRRRTTIKTNKNHLDDKGHQQLSLPKFRDRIQPKREKDPGEQFNGRGKIAHKQSTQTQQRKFSESIQQSLNFISQNKNKHCDTILENFKYKTTLYKIIKKLYIIENTIWYKEIMDKLHGKYE